MSPCGLDSASSLAHGWVFPVPLLGFDVYMINLLKLMCELPTTPYASTHTHSAHNINIVLTISPHLVTPELSSSIRLLITE